MDRVAAIVVTFNRKALLGSCLDALLGQRRPVDRIYVIDNASTDGTAEFLGERGYLTRDAVTYLRLPTNGGGAAGFHEGLKWALQGQCDWFWLMDDDAWPEPDALAELMAVEPSRGTAYGSCAVFQDEAVGLRLCWPVDLTPGEGGRARRVCLHAELRSLERVASLPFLGFFLSCELVERVGLPDRSYFLSGDDVDYSHRLTEAGAQLVCVKGSRIRHPAPDGYVVHVLWRSINCLRLAPWRRYYDIRNRIVNGRRHHGWGLVWATLPGVLVRWIATVVREPARMAQTRAYVRGIFDGLAGRMGRRWQPGT